ncbi:MAG: hypothetical protein SFY96_13870 [Planctomycetota bacterium]|nr:hypothetical protein [Planctomycetota bacterium]
MVTVCQRAAAVAFLVLSCLVISAARADSATAFTYQGQMSKDGQPLSGTALISFRLYAAASGGTALSTLPAAVVQVQNGLFTTTIDFGPAKFRDGKALGLDYGRIVPVAVEAIKQQAEEIACDRAEIAALKERLDRLEKASAPAASTK